VTEGMALLTIFVLAAFVGFEVISKVSTTLHTPLMSGANAIHGVILVAGHADTTGELVVALVAVVLATLNMVGGFVVTDRMLEMFGRGAPAARSSRQGKPANGDSGEAA
jgi:H+-translocating NAD(P) transhydrogenase subunit alpha